MSGPSARCPVRSAADDLPKWVRVGRNVSMLADRQWAGEDLSTRIRGRVGGIGRRDRELDGLTCEGFMKGDWIEVRSTETVLPENR